MDAFESLSHSRWACKYHVVFIPKSRRKALYGELRRHLGEIFRKLAVQRESRVEEGDLMPDHVHMMLSIPPKYAVSQVVGYIKGKSAMRAFMARGRRALQDSIFGRVGTSCRPLGAMKKRSATISETRTRKTAGLSN